MQSQSNLFGASRKDHQNYLEIPMGCISQPSA
jgi:hypothetical protein